MLALAGGLAGTLLALALVRWGNYSLTAEGFSIHVRMGAEVLATGLLLSGLLGVLAGLVPAWQASRRQITESFRAV